MIVSKKIAKFRFFDTAGGTSHITLVITLIVVMNPTGGEVKGCFLLYYPHRATVTPRTEATDYQISNDTPPSSPTPLRPNILPVLKINGVVPDARIERQSFGTLVSSTVKRDAPSVVMVPAPSSSMS